MRIFLLTLMCLAGTLVSRAQTAKECFLKMPEHIMPYLTPTNRADMPDFLSSNMQARVKNRFDEQTQMLRLSDDYLSLMPDSASLVQLKLLPLPDGQKVIALAYTLKAPAADSRLEFYTTDWQPLPAGRYFRRPEIGAFFLPADTLLREGAEVDEQERGYAFEMAKDAPLLEYRLEPGDNCLRVYISIGAYLDEDMRPRLMKYFRRSPLLLEWRDGRFAE